MRDDSQRQTDHAVEKLPLLGQRAQPADREGDAERRGHKLAREAAPGALGGERGRQPPIRVQKEEPNGSGEERQRGVQRHPRAAGQSRHARRVVQVAENAKQADQPGEQRRHLPAALAKARRPPRPQQRQPDQEEAERGVGRHPARDEGANGAWRLLEEELVNAQVPAGRKLDQRETAEQSDNEGQQQGEPESARGGRGQVRSGLGQPQRTAGEEEAQRGVGLHRYPVRVQALQDLHVEQPANQRHYTGADHCGGSALRDDPEGADKLRV